MFVPEFEELCKSVGLTPSATNVTEVLEKVSNLPEGDWGKVSPSAQLWFNNAADAINAGKKPEELVMAPAPAGAQPAKEPEKPKVTSRAKKEVPATPAAPVGGRVSSADPEHTAPAATPAVSAAPAAAPAAATTPAAGAALPGQSRGNPALLFAREYLVDNPNATPTQVAEAIKAKGFDKPPTMSSLQTIVYEGRIWIKIIAERGKK